VYEKVPVAALIRLDRDEALRIGRQLGVDRIVVGRFYGLRSQNSSHDFVITTYRRVVRKHKDDARPASTKTEYVEDQIHVSRHERRVWVSYDFSILDTRNGASLATRTATLPAGAVVVWTSDVADGDCDDYALESPDLEKSRPDAVRANREQWKQCAGDWKLPAFLERSRDGRDRAAYRSEYRREFYGFSDDHPIVLGELPPESDLAFVALDRVWEPVLAALKDLDEH